MTDGEQVRDPALQYCANCGAANSNHTRPEGSGHRCVDCGAFVRAATPEESHLIGKRMEQSIRHEQGEVTVGGYVPGVHGPEYGEDPEREVRTDGGGKTVTGELTQVIAPGDKILYAINDRTRALATDKYLTTLNTRDAPGVRGRVKRFVEWLRDPRGPVDGVYHVVFTDPPREGSEISVTLKPLAPDLWEATEYRELMTDGGAPREPFAPELDGDAFGRAWARLEEITGVEWEQVFPPGFTEMDPTTFYVRISLGPQVTGGTSHHVRETRYDPALEIAVMNGNLEIGEDEDGEPVVRLPDGAVGRGVDR